MSESDPRLLTETERESLREEVRQIRQDKAEGKWVLVNDRLLTRAAEHIEAVAARDEVIAKGIRVIDLDHQRLQKALEDIASALQAGDRAEAIEVLQKRGLWTE